MDLLILSLELIKYLSKWVTVQIFWSNSNKIKFQIVKFKKIIR